jgi:hypothetical protein
MLADVACWIMLHQINQGDQLCSDILSETFNVRECLATAVPRGNGSALQAAVTGELL